ncbi:MAG: ABC transporter substrate-binding protein [Oscillospiraceae bacterium]
MKRKVFINLFLVMILCVNILSTSVLQTNAQGTSEDYNWDRFKGQNKTVNVYNWGEYIDDEDFDVNDKFFQKTGVKVNYTTFGSNEELYARLKGGGVNYDVIIPSDYMISRLISEDMLYKLNTDNIPNIKNINKDFLKLAYDPLNEYSVPYTWGLVGILYNIKEVKEVVDSWDILWDEKYKDKTLMFDNSRDAFAIAQLKLGIDVNSTNINDYQDAKEELIKQKDIIQAYVMDQIYDKMGSGEAILAPYYSGDAIQINKNNPDVHFAVPKEGTNKFVDAASIPVNSENKEIAEMYINFLNEPEVAAANIEYIGYSTPNSKAYELLDDEIKENTIIYPSQSDLDKTKVFINLPENINSVLDDLWVEVKTSNNKGDSKGLFNNSLIIPILLAVVLIALIVLNLKRSANKKKDE